MNARENFTQWIPPGKREAADAYFDELEARLSKLEGAHGNKTPSPAAAPPMVRPTQAPMAPKSVTALAPK